MFRIIYSIGEIEFSMETERISFALAAVQGALQKERYSQELYERCVAVAMEKLVEIHNGEIYGADLGPIEIRKIDDEEKKEGE